MSLDDYDAVTLGWQEVHKSDDDNIEPPDAETVRRNMDRLSAMND